MSAVCPLILQKLTKKQGNSFVVTCRRLAYLRGLREVAQSWEILIPIFDSRTGHHFTCLTNGLTKPFVRFFYFVILGHGLCLVLILKIWSLCSILTSLSCVKAKSSSNDIGLFRLSFLKHMAIYVTCGAYAGMSHITRYGNHVNSGID